ncbi:hypothetical protein CDAR_183921 [Caerostris darwini]|uniref:Uncharacterized protein n=1 Tax=Caerostris darwini TaxID=1538125 RepID=A0AAV4TVQ1_9ARAC|nr:hypothetical protein CDAR_183921 [Caerostris darwini]
MHHCLLHLESPPTVSRSDTNPLITSIIRSGVPERSSVLEGVRGEGGILPQEKNRLVISGRIINCVVILAEDELIPEALCFLQRFASAIPATWNEGRETANGMFLPLPSQISEGVRNGVQEYFGYLLRTDADSSQ